MINCLTCNKIIENPRKGQIYCNQECYSKSPKLKEQAKKSKLIKDNSIPTYEERYGKEKAEGIKQKHSESIHDWVKEKLGKANHCEICGLEEIPKGMKRYFDWANISDEYKRDLDDWVQLCRKCHYQFDNLKRKKTYEVIGVEVKSNGYLSKEEKAKCRWLLDNNIFSKILIAKRGEKRGEIVYEDNRISRQNI